MRKSTPNEVLYRSRISLTPGTSFFKNMWFEIKALSDDPLIRVENTIVDSNSMTARKLIHFINNDVTDM